MYPDAKIYFSALWGCFRITFIYELRYCSLKINDAVTNILMLLHRKIIMRPNMSALWYFLLFCNSADTRWVKPHFPRKHVNNSGETPEKQLCWLRQLAAGLVKLPPHYITHHAGRWFVTSRSITKEILRRNYISWMMEEKLPYEK